MTLFARTRILAAGAGLAAAAVLAGTVAVADEGPEVVASGLDNPRLLSFSNQGDLYIAEAGTGGGEGAPEIDGPEGPAFFGYTGSITKVTPSGVQSRVLTGLPSLAGADGSGAIGPTDVHVVGPQRYAISMGLGNDPAIRDVLPAEARMFASLLTGTFASKPRLTADLGLFEATANPDSTDPASNGPDSNPGGFLAENGSYVAVDAGGNSLLRVGANGKVSLIAWFPETPDVPTGLPAPFPPVISMDAVPTSVAVGPDGAYYVSQLTGFPFPVGGSTIWRVEADGDREAYASGLTNVTDLAWHGSDLYAIQLFDNGLFAGPPGSLVKVTAGGDSPGDHETVQGGLLFPYGVAIRDGDAYVTTGAVLPDQGQVLRIPLG